MPLRLDAEKIVALFGTPTEAAAALGHTRQCVYQWVKKGSLPMAAWLHIMETYLSKHGKRLNLWTYLQKPAAVTS